MKIAVEGCCHGELDKIYETVKHLEKEQNIKIDLLLICGDFQAVRNRSDFHGMAVPPKYQKLNTFYKYYAGEKVAPVLTVFIGGNHEASNYLQELPYGGWVAPNIYYLGYAGVVQFGGIRIGGLSGIYKPKDYNKGHYERLPFTEQTKRSAYHVRNIEVFRLKQIKQPVDIFLSHDWPTGVYYCGNVNALLKKKPFFQEEIETGQLGSPPAAELLQKLQPNYWFSAHLHVKFAAVVKHQNPSGEDKQTNFLALDKCLPRRKFLQVIDVPSKSSQLELCLDPEWLSILKSTNHLFTLTPTSTYMPGPGSSDRYDFSVTPEEIKILEEDFGGEFVIPGNFEKTAPSHDSSEDTNKKPSPLPEIYVNSQTTLICEMLGIVDPNSVFTGKKSDLGIDLAALKEQNPDEIALDEDSDAVPDDDDANESTDYANETQEPVWQGPIAEGESRTTPEHVENPEEISLDSDDEGDKVPEGLETGSESPNKVMSPLKLPEPKISGLQLPKPVYSDAQSSDMETVDTLKSPERDLSQDNAIVNVEKSETDTTEGGSVPPVKKFKRRNQSFYESTDNE